MNEKNENELRIRTFKCLSYPPPKYRISLGIVCSIRNVMKIIDMSCIIKADPTSFLGSSFLGFVLELNFGSRKYVLVIQFYSVEGRPWDFKLILTDMTNGGYHFTPRA